MWTGDYWLQPRYVQAADLVSRLAEFAFRRLSASDQLKQIDEVVSKHQGRDVPLERPAELNVESDEDFRVKTFTELLQGGCIPKHIQYCTTFEILDKFSNEEEISLFKQLGSNDQQELVQKMLDRMKVWRCDIDEDILNRLPEESEEDFILRRFTKLYTSRYFPWTAFCKEEAAKYLLNSGNEITQLPHAEFWVGVSRIWFETLSADEQGEHIAVLTRKLLGAEAKDCTHKLLGDEAKGKLPGESAEDFRVRRFKELFEKLEPNSQRYLRGHIRKTLRDDLGLPRPLCADFSDGRSLFDNEITKFVNPNPREAGRVGRGGPTSPAQGGGGGGGQGTSSTTTSAQAS